MQLDILAGFRQHFSIIKDPRLDRKRLHNLQEIIITAVVAVICGCDNFCEIQEFAEERIVWFKRFLLLKNGIPSHDTYCRVFAILDPKEMELAFISWMKSITALSKGEVVALDGKALRGSAEKGTRKQAIHIVSAWASENGVALGQVKTSEKSNEITAIPELIKLLNLEGCIVTIDAMGTQEKIAKSIRDAKADYLLALKGNQGQLRRDVEYSFETAEEADYEGFESDCFSESSKGHGRTETREYKILKKLDWFPEKEAWQDLKSICMVTCTRTVSGKTSQETRYYISSLSGDAEKIGKAIRSHWSIENNLHWSLDVSFAEDACQTKRLYGPANFSVLRKIAINLVKKENSKKAGITRKRKRAGWSESYLEKILTC